MNEKITLQDIVNLLCEKQGISPKEAETFVRTMFDVIEEALINEKYIKIKGLGTFKMTEVNTRESVHVNTGERIEIQGHSKVSFTPDTSMKGLINKPFSHFETVVLNEGVELEDTVVEETEEAKVSETTVVPETTTPIEEPTIAPAEEEATPAEEATSEEEIAPTEKPIEEETITEEPVIEEPAVEEAVEETATEEPVAEEPITEEPVIEEPVIAESEPEVPVEETVLEEKIEEKPVFIEEKKEKNTNRILWGIIIVLVLIILFGFYWLFMRSDTPTEVAPTIPTQEEVVTPTPTEEEKQPEDTLETVPYVKLSAGELRNERVPSLADTLNYQIIGTKEEYTLQKGETIIRASVKFFGSKKYWPYIVKHNMDVLKDPDNIPAGTQVKIPVLTPKK